MRDAARLMAKVFAVFFGAGLAIVTLAYLVLGAFYIYKRIDAESSRAAMAPHTDQGQTFAPLYDTNGFIPDVLPDAQLDCEDKKGPWLKYGGKQPMCSVMIDGKIAAVITQQEVKDNLAGWMSVPPPDKK